LGFRFGDPVPVLLVQPELSDGLLAERFAWILQTAPDWLDLERVRENFHVLETAYGRPCLWHEHLRAKQSRHELTNAIERSGARVLLVDSLYMTFAGMDENAAEEMTLALDYLGGLTVSHGVAIILVHHFNKSGTAARGSSVYQGWGETDLTVSSVDADRSVVRVDALMRCAFPKGFPCYWQKPNETTAWFEQMPDGWEPERNPRGRKTATTSAVAALIARDRGPMRHTDLVQSIMEITEVSESTAKRTIKGAISEGLLVQNQGLYQAVKGGSE
jgi:hypothetical protein